MSPPIRVKVVVFLTASTLLCYEISLIRIYAVTQWQNLSPVIISMAMLGFGISGSLIFILKKRISQNTKKSVFICLILYPLTLFLGFVINSKLPFNPFLLGLESKEVLYLFISFLSIIIPFVFGASVFGILMQKYNIHKLYFLNLCGSGTGAIAVIVIQFLVHPFFSLIIVSGVAFLTAIIYSSYFKKKVFIGVIVLVIILISMFIGSINLLNLTKVSEFKPISQTLSIKDATILYERYSPYGLVQIVEANGLRSFPGLSIISPYEVPVQKIIYFDGNGGSAIIPFDNKFSSVKFLGDMTPAISYYVKKPSSVLIAGSGGGEGILRALYFKSENISAVEVNPSVIEIMKKELLDFSGGIYLNPKVKVIKSDIRSYINNSNKKYSLIELSFNDSFSSIASGVNALNESYLYTVESLESMYNKLDKDGLISITRWTVDPPRDNIKLLATGIKALESRGVNNPKEHIIAIRSLQTFTLLISKSKISDKEVTKTKDFATKNLFDLVYYPGIKESEPNRYIRLVTSYYYDAAKKLFSSNNKQYIKDHIFNIKPATDDKPYFYNFFKTKTINHILTYGVRWIPVTDWGYLLVVILFIFVILFSFIGILLPIKLKFSYAVDKDIVLYFSLLGISYFLIEIALIQKTLIYIGNPIYSASSIIAGLLIYSGIGSYFSDKIKNRAKFIFYSTICISLSLIFYLVLYNFIIKFTCNWYMPGKISIILVTMFPLGFFMGMPFPLGLTVIKNGKPDILPWAWGINGFFSVVSILLASLLSILLGYRMVLFSSCVTYLIAGFFSKRLYDTICIQ